MESTSWNPWHGCRKISPGCKHCYVYRTDSKYEKDSSEVTKTQNFDLPVRRTRTKEYKIKPGTLIYTCFTSDFFLEEADEWRVDAWKMIRERQDCHFFMITKRIDRFNASLPSDWGRGYDNVTICSTVENQDRADYRLPILLKAPICHKEIVCAPLLENINLKKYLTGEIECVSVGGESGNDARICDYSWVLSIRQQCIDMSIPFWYHQTGARLKKDGRVYRINRKYQHSQAHKANIDTIKNPWDREKADK